ncbi:MAG: hypothetical protein FWD28_07740 [Treponema sp.]|nr:hypothetical protein [Treponema sp.]
MFLFMFGACTRVVTESGSGLITWSGAYPTAILQTGEHPLWFKLTENGPVHIETIEDAEGIYAFVPWPYALHIRFLNETSDGVEMAVNRDGFLRLSPFSGRERGIALYHFSGGDHWRQYTVGSFIFYNERPIAVLYLDERFLNSNISPPSPRTLSFNMNSNAVFPVSIPALKDFPEDEGWNIDVLRAGENGLMFYRAARRRGGTPVVRMFRSADLSGAGEEIPVDVFFNSLPRQQVLDASLLPPLPAGFFYTGIGRVGNSLFASWEEQEDYSIGAAGFVVIKP